MKTYFSFVRYGQWRTSLLLSVFLLICLCERGLHYCVCAHKHVIFQSRQAHTLPLKHTNLFLFIKGEVCHFCATNRIYLFEQPNWVNAGSTNGLSLLLFSKSHHCTFKKLRRFHILNNFHWHNPSMLNLK